MKNNKVSETLKNDNKQNDNIKKDKTPTGKCVTKEQKDARRKAREEQYRNFRIGALVRRAKRMKLTDEEIKKKKEELIKQLESSNTYNILIMFNKNNKDMVMQILKNDNIAIDIVGNEYMYVTGDDDLLKDLRSMLPSVAKIYPYVKKKKPVLSSADISKTKPKSKTKAEKKKAASEAKKLRKNVNKKVHTNRSSYAKKRKEQNNKCTRKLKKSTSLLEHKKLRTTAKKATTVQIDAAKDKKASKSLKKVSTTTKKAALNMLDRIKCIIWDIAAFVLRCVEEKLRTLQLRVGSLPLTT